MSLCLKRYITPWSDKASAVSADRYSTDCTSTRHKTGNYNGIPVFVKFVETDSLTLSRDDILELELVIPHHLHNALTSLTNLQCNLFTLRRIWRNKHYCHRNFVRCLCVRSTVTVIYYGQTDCFTWKVIKWVIALWCLLVGARTSAT